MSASPAQGIRSAAGTSDSEARSLLAPAGVIIGAKAVVPRETELKGEITIGSRTILHPSAKILALEGPIVIGEGNIIEEKAEIRNCFPLNPDGSKKTLYVGNKNLLEAYSVVEGNIGNNNTISCKDGDERLPPDTVVLGKRHHRHIADSPQTPPFIDDHLEHLQRQLPNYHYILKSSLN